MFFFSFNLIHTEDATSDKIDPKNKEEYFNKVKSSMDSERIKQNQTVINDSKKQNRTFKTDYFAYIKIIIVLALVIAVIYFLSMLLKRFFKLKNKSGEGAVVIINQSLGPGKYIQVVNIAGKYLVLGVTNDSINLITEITDPKEIEKFEIISNEKKTNEGHDFIDIVTDFVKNKINLKNKKPKFDYEVDSIDFLNNQKERINNIKRKNKNI